MTQRVAAMACLASLLLVGCDDPRTSSEADTSQTAGDTGNGTDVAGAPNAAGGGEAPGTDDNGQAPGAPEPGGGGGLAPGSPMRMPARTQNQGAPLAGELDYIRKGLIAECRGTLCVKIDIDYRDSLRSRCQFSKTEPAANAVFKYRRNIRVTVIAGSNKCRPGETGAVDSSGNEQSTGPGSTTDGSTDGTTDGSTDGSTDGQPPDAGSTGDDATGGQPADESAGEKQNGTGDGQTSDELSPGDTTTGDGS
jgi:hypothetical protein